MPYKKKLDRDGIVARVTANSDRFNLNRIRLRVYIVYHLHIIYQLQITAEL